MVKKVSSVGKTIKKKVAKPKARTEPSRSIKKEAVGVKKSRSVNKNPVDLNDVNTLQQELKQRTDELAILNSVGEAMAKTLDVKTVVKIVGDKVQSIFAAEAVTIRLYDPTTNLIHRAYDYDFIDGYEDLTDSFFPLGKGLNSIIIESGKPLFFGSWEEAKALGALLTPSSSKNDPLPQAFIGAPIFGGDKVIGTVSVQSYKQNTYNENHLRLLQTLASNMGVAIQNARLFEAEQQRKDELAILNSVGEAMAKTLDVKTVVKIVGDKVQSIFNSEIVSIRLYDPSTNLIQRAYDYDGAYEDLTHTSFPIGKGLTTQIIESGKPLLFSTAEESDIAGTLKSPSILNPTEDTQSYLGVPIIVNDKVIGAVSIQSYKRHAYNENSLRLLQTLSANMGVAIQNARLFEAEQERVAELQIINSIQQGLAAELDFQAIVDLVGDKLREVFNTPDLAINWYNEKDNLINYLYFYEHGNRMQIEPRTPSPNGIFSRMQKNRQPVIWNSQAEGDAIGTVIPGTDNSKSGVSLPIISSDRVLGSIQLENYERDNAYGESELRLLTTVSASLGTALENARLFDETQRLLKITEDRAAELAIINSVSEGLVRELDFQAIIDLVGEKIRKEFKVEDMYIALYDSKSNIISTPYYIEHSDRFSVEPHELGFGYAGWTIKNRNTLVINENIDQRKLELGIDTSITVGDEDEEDLTQSVVCAPIWSSGKVIGVITLYSNETNAFPESSVSLLTTLCANLGVALQNARLFDETQRLLKLTEDRAAELAILNSVGEAMSKTLDVKTVTYNVGDKIREIFNVEIVDILMFDSKTNMMQLTYSYAGKYFENEPPWELTEGGLTTNIIKTRQPLLLKSAKEIEEQGAEAYVTSPSDEPDIQSYMGVPIMVGEKILGVVDVQSVKENALDESDLRLLQTLSANMGIAIENARLFDETQRLLKETEQRAAELSIINSVGEAMSKNLDVPTVVKIVGDKVRDIFNADVTMIALAEVEKNLSRMAYAYDKGYLEEMIFPLDTGLGATVIKTRQPLLLNTSAESDALSSLKIDDAEGNEDQTESWLGVPIIVGDAVLGNVSVQSYKQYAYNEDSVRLLQTLSANMGVAIENARLFEETNRLLKETEERAKELLIINDVQSNLSASMETQAMYQLVGDKIQQVFDAQVVTISEYDPQLHRNTWRFAVEKGERLTIEPSKPIGFSKHIIDTRRMILVNAGVAERRKALGGAVAAGQPAKSYLGVPLLINNEVRGIISLQNIDHENAFSESDVRLLQTLASSMSVALENARLLEETRRRERENIALLDISRDISSTLDSSTVLQGIATHAHNVLQAALSGLFLPEEKGQLFRAIAAVGDEAENLRNDTIKLGEGILGDIAKNKVGEIVNDVDNDKRAVQITGTDVNSDEHLLAVPLMANDELIGLMSVWRNGKNKEFLESELEFLTGLSRQAVIAIQNAK
ncbi:MAG: GAF domain-containing protein, partial [Anaerolineales bacterium]|nr:GAF domain-containing protein [Anaerolineales bacterium]